MAHEFDPPRRVLHTIAEKMRNMVGGVPVDISKVMEAVEQLLDESVAAEGYVIKSAAGDKQLGKAGILDLSQIDFEALRQKFEQSRKRTAAEKLRRTIEGKLHEMVELNKSRFDFLEKFRNMIDEYNAGSQNIDHYFKKLVAFAQELAEEEQRAVAGNLTEEELAVFDLLTRPEMTLTNKEEAEVKRVAKELLARLKAEKLVLDWRKKQQNRASVRLCIEEVLDELPEAYTRQIWPRKCASIYQHVYDSYYGAGRSIYAMAG